MGYWMVRPELCARTAVQPWPARQTGRLQDYLAATVGLGLIVFVIVWFVK